MIKKEVVNFEYIKEFIETNYVPSDMVIVVPITGIEDAFMNKSMRLRDDNVI